MKKFELVDVISKTKEKACALFFQMSFRNFIIYMNQVITNIEFTISGYEESAGNPDEKYIFLLNAWCKECRSIVTDILKVKILNKDDIELYTEVLLFKLEELEITLNRLQQEPIEYYF